MNIYIVVLVLLILLSIWEFIFKTKRTVYIGAIGLAILAGFRAVNVGPDTANYVVSYEMLHFGDVTSYFESGFTLFEKICFWVGMDYSGFLFSFSLTSLVLLAIFLNKYSPIPSVSLLYYYARYFMSRDMNQIRQSLATIIALFSIKYIVEKKPIKFLAVVLLAAQFHKVAYIMIAPYILINYLHFNEKHILTKYLGMTLVSLTVSASVPMLLGRFAPNSAYVSYSGYTQSLGLLNPVLILELVISVSCCFYILRQRQDDHRITVMMLMYMLGSNVLVVFNQYSVIGGRVSSTLTTVEIIIIIYLATMVLKGTLRNLSLVVASVAVFGLINIYSGAIKSYLPYTVSVQKFIR